MFCNGIAGTNICTSPILTFFLTVLKYILSLFADLPAIPCFPVLSSEKLQSPHSDICNIF